MAKEYVFRLEDGKPYYTGDPAEAHKLAVNNGATLVKKDGKTVSAFKKVAAEEFVQAHAESLAAFKEQAPKKADKPVI